MGELGALPLSPPPEGASPPLSAFSPQCGRRANGYIHCAQQHPGAREGGGAARRVPSREELTASEAAYGANLGKDLRGLRMFPQRCAELKLTVDIICVGKQIWKFSCACKQNYVAETDIHKGIQYFNK